MCEEVERRAREKYEVGQTISLGIGYSKHSDSKGSNRTRTNQEAINSTMKIYHTCLGIFNENYTKQPVRQISISITKLKPETTMQLSLFDTKKWEDRRLSETVDNIRSVYGPAERKSAV